MTSLFADSATRCLEADHRGLDATLLEAEKAARAGSFPEARAHFAAFASGLIRHIEAEEDELFPQRTGRTGALAERLRRVLATETRGRA